MERIALGLRAEGTSEDRTSRTELVSVLRLAIAERIGASRFELWFAKTRFELTTKAVRILAPNLFHSNWLRQNFRSQIEDSCREIGRSGIAIEFRVAEETSPPSRTEPGSGGEPTSQPVVVEPAVAQGGSSGLQPKRRFAKLEDFVVGVGNQMARTSVAMAMDRLGSINPIYWHGPTGVGKTHLSEGMWRAVRSGSVRRRAIYLTAEQFTNFFLEALHGRGLPNFRRRYRGLDLLIIEDIQFLAGKRATQTELINTIDSFAREGRQLLFTGDRPLNELTELSDELRTRLSGGLACAVQPPDLATREGIVHLGAQQRGLQLAAGVSHLIAESIVDDARRLHGALNLLMAASRLNGWSEISREDAESTLQETFQSQQRSYRLDEIEQAVCQVFGVDARSLKSDAKAKRVSQPRMLAMWLARKYSRAALSEIGGHFGRRSHSTVISAQKKVEGWLASGATVHTNGRDFRIDEAVRQLETRLRTG